MQLQAAEKLALRPLLRSRGLVEFHVNSRSRDRYGFEESVFSKRGHIVSADYPAAQRMAQRINEHRRADRYPERRVTGSEIYVLGLIHEIFHHIIHSYLSTNGADILKELHASLRESFGREELGRTLRRFLEEFPPTSLYRGDVSVDEYLEKEIEGTPALELTEEEILLLWVTNQNPAVERYQELFDDRVLNSTTVYRELMAQSYLFFQKQPGIGSGKLNLIEFLRAPAHAVPDDLMGQLEYIRDYWGEYIGEWAQKLLTGIDLLREESRPRFGTGGPGPAYELSFGGLQDEIEQFSEDTDWMPRVVLIAKSTFVWLDQLSKRYRRPINRLDEIPDEELDRLAGMGFSSLWLIGLWERSIASKTIKRSCGNPEAEASAYSLKRYEIAEELGGWEALANLRERAWRRGIRLASDMVPNHTGIDGDWVYDHPDWFLQLPEPPYPAYSYNSRNLSDHPGIGIYLEDHYYDRTDAALTFKRVDFDSGDTRYIYHGNDGTSMPWNDTAQLDYLNPDTREAIIQTIVHVARNFPIIRFDAAMTLAKKHIHRLWYPSPGHGGDIPGRSIHGLSEEEFDRRMPKEFWREVVDRVAEEAPDTLLLAEAFWMMEGYFVRSLGMHRVYNSAFMNMLKDEENEKYKNTVKNTLSFEPEILGRFVNFMNNPDEETAIAQFGAGEKYIGVSTLMVTMPGLPMFGHGQIEGFREKYGMEYRRAYWDEIPNEQLITDHYRFVFPLMKRRHLFSQVRNFLLYDLHREDGSVDHNVFAYSNRSGGEKALVLFNNSYYSTSGYIKTSTPYARRSAEGGKETVRSEIADGLELSGGNDSFTIFREQRSGLQYIRESQELRNHGLHVSLHGYESQVYLDIYEVYDEHGLYRRLFETLDGRGTPDIERAKKELYLRPAHSAFRRLLTEEFTERLAELLSGAGTGIGSAAKRGDLAGEPKELYNEFLKACTELGYGSEQRRARTVETFGERLAALDELDGAGRSDRYLYRGLEVMPEAAPVLLSWLLLSPLAQFASEEASQADTEHNPEDRLSAADEDCGAAGSLSDDGTGGDAGSYTGAADFAEDTLLPEQFFPLLRSYGVEEVNLAQLHSLILAVTEIERVLQPYFGDNRSENVRLAEEDSAKLLEEIIRKDYVSRHLGINRHLDVEWFRGEAFQEIVWWTHLTARLKSVYEGLPFITKWLKAEEQAEYRLQTLIEKA